MMQHMKLIRKRLIPQESVPLDHDRVLFFDGSTLVTAWNAIRPRRDLACGYSLYLIDRGLKLSRFYGHDHAFLYWYCDIIDTAAEEDGTYVFTDLLADVKIYPDGGIRVLDLDELSSAYEKGLLTLEQFILSLKRLGSLLDAIRLGTFDTLSAPLLSWEKQDMENRGQG